MRNLDFSPFYRSTVGFDRLFNMLDANVASDWPPYNIEKIGEDDYRISMAVAGFKPDEIELTQHGNALVVSGAKKAQEEHREVLHQGIASRSFKQSFRLADHVKVVSATLEDGLLVVSLVREVPEQLKPRQIAINSVGAATPLQDNSPQQITEGSTQRAKAAA